MLKKPKAPEPAKTRVELRLWVEKSGMIKHSEKDPSVLGCSYHEVLFDTTGQPYCLKD